ncbi:MAG TPA: methyltransferase domain-containing protein [bacterium]|jgi:SAM-dependent methyltransferase|nr:methyltransferase domain-containing protein [bacterium]
MLEKLRKKFRETVVQKHKFLPGPVGIFVNSSYIIHRGIYRAVAARAEGFHGDILDFGCGTKPYRSLFNNARTYVGLELQMDFYDKRSDIDAFYDGKTLPFADGSFDGVFSTEVMMYVPNIDQVLDEFKRVLRPGGRLLIVTPFTWEEDGPEDLARYTAAGFALLLRKHGFDNVVTDKTTSSFLASWQHLTMCLVRYLRFGTPYLFIPSMNLSGLALDRMLPKKYDSYCNVVAQASKPIGGATSKG